MHWNTFDLGNATLDRIRGQLPVEDHPKIVEVEYVKWDKQNIISSDLILDFELINSNALEKWCNNNGFGYSQSTVDLIRKDLKTYQ